MESNVPALQRGKMVVEARPSIAKFQISKDDAANHFREWVNTKSFVAKDFDITGSLEKITGIWIPAWIFEVSAESAWHGEVSHTEEHTEWVNKCERVVDNGNVHYVNKKVPETRSCKVWEPISGHHYGNYGVPVSASDLVTQKEIEDLKYNQLEYSLTDYDESHLDGWQVQAADLNKMEAKEICNELINELETEACKHEVERLNGCSTKLTYNISNFALLPMFGLSYTYKDKTYSNHINGVTGEVCGNVPINKVQKYFVIAALVMAVIAFIYFMISQNR